MSGPVICLGKTGDLILLFPAFKAVHDRTGIKPKVVVAHQFAGVFDGISYADPIIFDGDWMNIPEAIKFAKSLSGDSLLVKWWDDSTLKPDETNGSLVLRVHGRDWSVDQTKWADFMTSMYERFGFTRDEMMTLPLIFDKRDSARESQLVKTFTANNKKPLLLLNFTGEASPFPLVPEVMRYISPFQNRLNIVRLDNLRAERIYDLLGLMDRAIGMITIDTATLHLAHGGKTPYIAFTRDGWSGSIPRGNCSLEIKYSVAAQRASEIHGIIEGWLTPESVSVQENKIVQPSAGISKCWMLERKRIPLPNVTLWGCCWSTDQNFYSKTVRVLRYCAKLFEFERVLFFSFMPPPKNWEFDFIQVPETNFNGWNIFVNSIAPLALKSDFAMSVHEDGFPIRPDLWNKRFLDYDYIGAPWADGVVGNGGFNIESQRLMREKTKLPPYVPPFDPSDNYICRTHRHTLEQRGIKFAPTDVALDFSTELTGQHWPSLGFHGRRFQPEKYHLGWQTIIQYE